MIDPAHIEAFKELREWAADAYHYIKAFRDIQHTDLYSKCGRCHLKRDVDTSVEEELIATYEKVELPE